MPAKKGTPSFAETHPDLALEADGWDPSHVTAGSGKKRGWRCSVGHTWITEVKVRASGSGCPVCAGRSVWPGENDLATKFPELALQADGWDPTTTLAGGHSPLSWACNEGHRWKVSIQKRLQGHNCPVCSGHQVITGINDLASLNPVLAAEADGWDPKSVSVSSGTTRAWRCSEGHKWVAVVANRTRGSGCPYCANQKVLAGFNDFATNHPDLATQADGWNPASLTSGTSKRMSWRCERGHRWKASVGSRANGTGCPICSNRTVLAGFNDLAHTHSHLAKEADGWDPSTVTAGSNKRLQWRCSLGHKWVAAASTRARGVGCPTCTNRIVLAGFNDLATTHPNLAKESHGWDPSTVTAGTPQKHAWKCRLGHKWRSQVNTRANGVGCPICSNKAVLAGFNDLATTHPDLATQADGWDPKLVTAGSNKNNWWRCQSGHRWRATPHNRSRGTDCPSCTQYGYDPNKDGYIYFLEHPVWDLFQIGITTNPKRRIKEHQELGWNVVNIQGPMNGHHAQLMETDLLRFLKTQGAIFAIDAQLESFDGSSEAWLKSTMRVKTLQALITAMQVSESKSIKPS